VTSPPGSSRPVRELIHEDTLPFPSDVDRFDLPFARQCFSTLFDRAAQTVFRAGYDLDDVTVDQFIVLRRIDGAEVDTRFSEWLRDMALHTKDQIIALRVRVYLERSA